MLARKIGIRSPIQAFLSHSTCSTFEELAIPVFSGFSSSADSDDDQREHEGAITRRFLNLNPFQITPIGYQPLSCLAKQN